MNKSFDKIFLQRRYTNVLQVHNRMFKIRQMQIKTTRRYHLKPIRMSIIKNQIQQVLSRMQRKGKPCALLMGRQNGAVAMNNIWSSFKKLKITLHVIQQFHLQFNTYYGLNCVSPSLYVEFLISSTLECDCIEI